MFGSAVAQNIIQDLTKEPGVPTPPPELRLAFQVHLKMWKGQIKKFSEDEIDANAFFQGCAPDRRVLGGKPRARVEKLGDEVEKEGVAAETRGGREEEETGKRSRRVGRKGEETQPSRKPVRKGRKPAEEQEDSEDDFQEKRSTRRTRQK